MFYLRHVFQRVHELRVAGNEHIVEEQDFVYRVRLDEIGELDGQLARIEDIYCFIIRAEPRYKGICVALFDNNNALVALCIGRYLDNAVVAADNG